MIKVLFVCLGNICRSPMAEAVFRKMVNDEHLADRISIDSAATSSWEAGNPVHHGTKNRLKKEGISVDGMYSRQLNRDDLVYDYIIGMDNSNITNIHQFLLTKDKENIFSGKVRLLLEFSENESEDKNNEKDDENNFKINNKSNNIHYSRNKEYSKNKEIADPYYTGDFDSTYNDVVKGCKGLLKYIKVHNLNI